MDNFFSSPALFEDLHTKTAAGLLDQIEKGCQRILDQMKLKRGVLKTKVKGNLTAIVCKDKRNVNILKNLHSPPLEGNFCDEHGKAMKPAIIQDYSRHMGYADKSDCMTNSYSISRQTWKWTKKLFFHLLDLIIVNGFIILASCGSK